MAREMVCPYCGRSAELVTGDRLYPHRKDLAKKMARLRFWLCSKCDAYVGCHQPDERYGHDGTEPLGTLADEGLRGLRTRLHNAFDPIWKSGELVRTEAYQWLADSLGIPVGSCHVAMFDKETCRKALEVLKG